jgi:hypothetical protein
MVDGKILIARCTTNPEIEICHAKEAKSPQKKKPTGRIIDTLLKQLREPLDNDNLREMTFRNLETAIRQLQNLNDQDPMPRWVYIKWVA